MLFLNIILTPLISAIICGLGGNLIGYRGSKEISTFILIFTCLFSFYMFYLVGSCNAPYYLTFGTWINSDILNIKWFFFFDSLTLTIRVIINTVSALVYIYSASIYIFNLWQVD